MSSFIQKFKINFFNFSKFEDIELLEGINFRKYPTQFVFDAYSGLEIWGRQISNENEQYFVKLWNMKNLNDLSDIKILKRYILDSIGIIIIIEKEKKDEFMKFWTESFLNYPILIITDIDLKLDVIKNDNIKMKILKDLNSFTDIEKEILEDLKEIKNSILSYRCADCNHDLLQIPDGNFRYCFCGKSGINHSETITRLMGNTFEVRKRI